MPKNTRLKRINNAVLKQIRAEGSSATKRAYYADDKRKKALPKKDYISLVVEMNFKNKRYFETIGHWPDMSWSTFDKLATDYIADIINGRYQSLSNIKVKDFNLDVVEPYSKKNHKDSSGFKQRLKPFIEAHGDDYVRDISKLHINGLLNRLTDVRSNPTLARYLAAFSKFMSMAVDHEIIDRNPCKGIKKPSENPPRTRSLYPEEIPVFIRASLLDVSPTHALAQLLCLFTGLRPSNVKPIELSWFKRDFTELHLPDAKDNQPHIVYLNAASIEIIKLAMAHSDGVYLFPGRKSGSPIINMTKCVNRVRKAVQKETGITEHYQLRDLRRTHASMQLRVTGDVRLVQQTLFHKHIDTTTLIYAHHRNDKLLEASEKTADALLDGKSLSTYLPKN